jgi:hypothetical protein
MNDRTLVNDELYVSQDREVLERIPLHDEHVGLLANLQRAQRLADTADLGSVAGCSDDDLHRRQSGVVQLLDFVHRHTNDDALQKASVVPQGDFAASFDKPPQVIRPSAF